MHWVSVFRLMFELIKYMDWILYIYIYIYISLYIHACIRIQRVVTRNRASISANTEIFRSPSQTKTAFNTKLTLLLNTTPKSSLYDEKLLHVSGACYFSLTREWISHL